MSEPSAVLVSWVARNNDPFEEPRSGSKPEPGDARVPGPTLTLLFDEASPYREKVGDVVLLYRRSPVPKDAASDQRPVDATVKEIGARSTRIRVHPRPWPGEDPTDHGKLFEFLREEVPRIRSEYRGRELLIHVSPGTPAMHTLWVLMAECGFIDPPFRVVKSYRPRERGDRPAVVEVSLGIENFYKVYRASQPRRPAPVESAVFWDPAKFRSPQLKALFAEARRYARLKVPVLILGERGTGKTTLASWLRSCSPFRREELDRNWPSVACGQFSGDTIKSELFGHKAGSFTDAKQDKKGLLAAAHRDTLFLDEIGDISRDVQRLLIRALEERRYTPLGGESDPPLESDFRLITATNLTWDALQERLAPDFLDRISLFELRMPALRELRDDLPWLWESLYASAVERAGLESPPPPLAPAEQQRLLAHLAGHPLPGNMRDLLRLAYRLISLLSDPERACTPAEAVDVALTGLADPAETGALSQVRAVAGAFSRNESLDAVLTPGQPLELDLIEGALQEYVAHELARIAAARGVSQSTLYTGVSDRTLYNWRTQKSSSGERKGASARKRAR